MTRFMLLIVLALVGPTSAEDPIQGPMLGELTSGGVTIWFRPADRGDVPVEFFDSTGGNSVSRSVVSDDTADGACTVRVDGLKANTRYTYRIADRTDPAWWFQTRPDPDLRANLAFGSCAREDEGAASVWRRMDADGITGVVLLGDTPYIDTTNLEYQRKRYREFVVAPGLSSLVAHVPVYSTWDDHDFGRNDTDGRLKGKENSRQAFLEHRPQKSEGPDGQGIYTSFRQGPVEVFILDTRWFARTEGTTDDPTLLGAAQWAWLERKLAASEAPFKILACGMIFNSATRPGKTDHWGLYPREYDRLIDLLSRVGSDGVVLVGGDIHWSREIEHDTRAELGHTLTEFITSPIHDGLIKAADAPHPGIRFTKGIPHVYLQIDATTDPGTGTSELVARFRDGAGTTHHQKTIVVEPPTRSHRLITQGNGRLAIVDRSGEVEWEMPWGGIHDLHVLPDGHVMVQRGSGEVVEIDPSTREVVWSYDSRVMNGNRGTPVEVHAFQPLPPNSDLNPSDEWRLMIAESGPARIIEVDRDGVLQSVTPMTVRNPHPHTDTRLVRKIAADRYLVCHEADGAVREYEQDTGRVAWDFDVPMGDGAAKGGHGPEAFGNKCFAAVRLHDGHTLIATGNGHGVIKVTPTKEVVWSLTQNELPGIRLAWVTTLEVHPDGAYVIGNCHAGPGQPLLVKIDPETKDVLWTFDQFERFGNSVPNSQILDRPAVLR